MDIVKFGNILTDSQGQYIIILDKYLHFCSSTKVNPQAVDSTSCNKKMYSLNVAQAKYFSCINLSLT